MPTSAADFQAKVTKTVTNMDRLDGIVNGDVSTVVHTDAGDVPSLPKVIGDFEAARQAMIPQFKATFLSGSSDLSFGAAFGVDASTYFQGAAVTTTGTLTAVNLPAVLPAGTYKLLLATKSGSTFTLVDSHSFTRPGGTAAFQITDWNPAVTAGTHYLGLYAVSGGGGLPAYRTASGQSQWYAIGTLIAGAQTMTQASGYELLLSALIEAPLAGGVAPRLVAAESSIGQIQAQLGPLVTKKTFGQIAGAAAAGAVGFTYMNAETIGTDGIVSQVVLPAGLPDGTYTLFLATRSGTSFMRVSERDVVVSGGAQVVVTNWNPAVPTAGTHYFGYRGVSGSAKVTYLTPAAGAQWYVNGPISGSGTTMSGVSGYVPAMTLTVDHQQTLDERRADTAPLVVQGKDLPSSDRVSMLTTGWNAMLVYGQSLGEGYSSTAPISTTQPYANKTFGSGPRSGKSGNVYGAVNTSPGTSTSKALVEDAVSPSAAGFTGCGETICTGATSELNTRAAVDNGLVPTNLVQFASCAAHGSYRLDQLYKGAGWYGHLLDHIGQGIALAQAASVDYQLTDVPYIQGEADADSLTSRSSYLPALLQLRDDIERDYRALVTTAGGSVIAKSNPVHMLILQVSTWGAGATLPAIEAITLAQRDAALSSNRIHLVAPGYPLPRGGDKVHLTAAGELRAARIIGRARKQILVEARAPDAFEFVAAYAKGTSLTIQCRVPVAPLVFDTTSLAAATNNGIVVKDDTGTLTLSAITISGSKITITLNRALGANPKFRYALDQSGATAIGLNGPWGNLRDSTPDTFTYGGTTYAIPHWAPHAELGISVLENL